MRFQNATLNGVVTDPQRSFNERLEHGVLWPEDLCWDAIKCMATTDADPIFVDTDVLVYARVIESLVVAS